MIQERSNCGLPKPKRTGATEINAMVAGDDQLPSLLRVNPTRRQMTAAVMKKSPMKSKFFMCSRIDLRGTGFNYQGSIC